MPVNTYETLFLLDPTKLAADGDAVRQQVLHLLERNGAAVTISREWNYNQKLTYPIAKQKKGAFHIVYYTMDASKQAALEADLRLADAVILRHMTLKVDPKWEEVVLNVARDDAGREFAIRGMKDETAVQTDPAAIGAEPAPGTVGGPPGGDRDGDRDGAPPPRGPRGRRPEFASDKPE